ncbi:hypothetical protein D3C72_510100 [compost metagenome]
MFNRASPFNRLTFNRQLSVFVFGSAILSGDGGLTVQSSADMTGSSHMDADGVLSASFTREITFAAKMDAEAGMSTSFIREIMKSAIMNGIGSLKVNGSRYHVDEIEFTGPFAPGDRIIIDSKKLKVTQNGENALHLMQGNFFDLNIGDNNITYTDPETGRDILIRITFKDKFV